MVQEVIRQRIFIAPLIVISNDKEDRDVKSGFHRIYNFVKIAFLIFFTLSRNNV